MPDNKHTPDIKCYRINYNSKYWANVAAVVGNQCSSPVGAVFAVNALCDAYEDIAKQRDELLAALEKCRKELSAWMRDHGDDIATQEAVADARAAIASGKGQK